MEIWCSAHHAARVIELKWIGWAFFRPPIECLYYQVNQHGTKYIKCLTKTHWVLSLSEPLYWEVVCFVLEYYTSSTIYNDMRIILICKYHKEDGSIALASVQEVTKQNGLSNLLGALEKRRQPSR